jgi:hypothetical protein
LLLFNNILTKLKQRPENTGLRKQAGTASQGLSGHPTGHRERIPA